MRFLRIRPCRSKFSCSIKVVVLQQSSLDLSIYGGCMFKFEKIQTEGWSKQKFLRSECENESNRHPQTQNKKAAEKKRHAEPSLKTQSRDQSCLERCRGKHTPCVTLLPTVHILVPASAHSGTRSRTRAVPLLYPALPEHTLPLCSA